MALVPFQRSNSSVPASSSSSSSSFQTCPPQWAFDVFLSFRGEDTRNNFISHLYKELDRRGIKTFIDDQELERGKEISPELLKAIEESRFSIVVISKRYASSSWCLDELVKILECMDARRQIVYPVFFHVDPSEVRKQTGTFGEGFDELVSKHEIAKVETWREALKGVANLSGFAEIGSESKLLEEIVGKIFYCLNHKYTSVDEGLVGTNSHMKKVIELLGLGMNDSRVVGIWGMGGIGKTTIAKVVYERIFWQFDGDCFIENVRAVSKEYGVMFLQEQLISGILKEKGQKVYSINSGKSMIKRILSNKKVLIVLDDVDESIELENLLGNDDWLSSGSKIIITSRNLHVLNARDAINPYKICELGKDEAVKLFKSKAFRKGEQPGEGYGNLLDGIVEYCKGVPLALVVLGSCLRGREETDWKDVLKELKWECASPGLKFSPLPDIERVFNVLKISYDALSLEEREIFLDIAFFFKEKNKNYAIEILESYTVNPKLRIKLLLEKSLITISWDDRLIMHDLIQEMGRNIVFQESPKEPGQRSRLWFYEDIKHVLMNNTGTQKVEVVVMEDRNLESRDPKDFEFLKELKLSSKAFENMRNLTILKIRYFYLSEDLKYLPNNLRYLDWHGCPLRCMPSEFQPMHLVELHMTDSKIEQLWTGTKVLYNLRFMSLDFSKYLSMSPNFETVPNLEFLYLRYCTSLVNLHPSIGSLRRLIELYLDGCENIESLPSSINQLSTLRNLYLCNCKRLQELPELSSNICFVEANRCESLRTIASLSIYKDIRGFSFSNCSKLVENKESNILSDKFLSNLFQGSCNREKERFVNVFPGSDIPKWFNHQRNGSSMCLELPPRWFNNSKFLGIAVAFVGIMKERSYIFGSYGFTMNRKTIRIYRMAWRNHVPHGIKFKNVVVFYIPRNNLSSELSSDLLNGGEITIKPPSSFGGPVKVKKWGFRLVYKEDVEENNDEALTIYNNSIFSSQYDNNLNLVVSQGVEEEEDDNNAPLLKRRPPSESGDFQKEDFPNIKRPRPRLEQEFNTRVTPPPNRGNNFFTYCG